MIKITEGLKQRFWDKVDVKNDEECWEWKASLTIRGGYGQLTNGRGKLVKAHRLSYEMHHGEVPKGLMVCHKCNNPKCCNPNHLYAGTPKDNWHDTINSGHDYKLPPIYPEDVHCAKINYKIADVIRYSEESCASLGKQYGISKTMVSRIKRGLSWKIVI